MNQVARNSNVGGESGEQQPSTNNNATNDSNSSQQPHQQQQPQQPSALNQQHPNIASAAAIHHQHASAVAANQQRQPIPPQPLQQQANSQYAPQPPHVYQIPSYAPAPYYYNTHPQHFMNYQYGPPVAGFPYRPPHMAPLQNSVPTQQSKSALSSDNRTPTTNQPQPEPKKRTPLVIRDPITKEVVDFKNDITITSAASRTTTASSVASNVTSNTAAPSIKSNTETSTSARQNPAAQSFAQKVSEVSLGKESDTSTSKSTTANATKVTDNVQEQINSSNKENISGALASKETSRSTTIDKNNFSTPSLSSSSPQSVKQINTSPTNVNVDVSNELKPSSKVDQIGKAVNDSNENEAIKDDSKKTSSPESSPARAEQDDRNSPVKDTTSNSAQESSKSTTASPEIDPKDDTAAGNSGKEIEEAGKTSLTYEPGQFNPVSNRTGKRVYSKEFLDAVCRMLGFDKMLDEEPNYEVSNLLGTQVDPFAPSFARGRDAHRPNHNYSGRSSAGPDRPRKIIPTTSYQQEVELKTVEKPWKPSVDAKDKEVDSEVAETELIKKKFRSILNKLTPNNFENLAKTVTSLNINTESKLGDVIDIVFAKALAEPGYCVLYGQMCSHLKKITAGQANFGNTLLKRCQGQFQADIYAGLNLDERKEKIEKEENPETKKQLNEELYEDMFRCRLRGLGLIKFIGELYKIEMLNDSIMFDCILRLLQDPSEESLECLCDLLTTIGEKLDNSSKGRATDKKAPKPTKSAYATGQKSAASVVATGVASGAKAQDVTLDYVFSQMKKLREDDSSPLSLRIRFKILDTVDLRERFKWKSKDNNPKKLEEIREAHKEQLEKEKRQQTIGRRSQEGRRGGMGNQSGSSGQISSMANDSSGNRGNMHTSSSSLALRDYPGDSRPNHASDTVDHQKKVENLRNLTNFLPSITSNARLELRPSSWQRSTLTSGPNSQTTTKSTTNKTS